MSEPVRKRVVGGQLAQGDRPYFPNCTAWWRWDRRSWAWLAAVALCGAAWGGLLGRLLLLLWPVRLHFPTRSCCWIASPLLPLALGLIGAFVVPLGLHKYCPSHDWRSLFAVAWPLAIALPHLLQPVIQPLWAAATLVAGLATTAWLSRQTEGSMRSGREWPWDLLAFAVPLALYLSTLAPSVLPGDSGEFQFAPVVLGIPHPTGYPLYLLLGRLFALLPVGSVAYRLNLLSACAGAGAVWAVYRAGRALELGRVSAFLGALLLTVSDTLWSQATIAEKYALNALFVSLTLWLGLRWRRDRLAGRAGRYWLSAWALCYGVSLTHHRTMVLFAPAYLWLLWTTDPVVLRWRSLWRLALWTCVPLALYLVLPLFSALDPPYAYIRVDSVAAFKDLVLASPYQGSLFRGGWAPLPSRLADLGRLLVRQFGPIGLTLAAAGPTALARRNKSAAAVLLVGILAQAAFALNYDVPNRFVYYMPVYVWLAVCAAVAVDTGLTAIQRLAATSGPAPPKGNRRSPGALGWTGVACWVLAIGVWSVHLGVSRLPGMDQRRAYSRLSFDYTYALMAAHSLEEGALVVSDWLPATVLWYGQFVEGFAPSAQVAVADPLEALWEELADHALSTGRPVYLARPLATASGRHILTSAGPLVRVLDEPDRSLPMMALPLDAALEGEMHLLGADLVATAPGPEGELYVPREGNIRGDSTLHVTLYWRAEQTPEGDYAVTLQLTDANDHVWLERQSRHPVGGSYPTSRWQPMEVVADYYELDLPSSLPSGTYRLRARMGVPFFGTGLKDAQGRDALTVATVTVDKPLRWPGAGPQVALRRAFGRGLMLEGYTVPKQISPGEMATLSVQWLVCNTADAGGPPSLTLVSRRGESTTISPLLHVPEDWVPGARVVETYTFPVPEDLARVQLRCGKRCAWGRRRYRLPIQVVPLAPPIANFGNQVQLLDYRYEAGSLRGGDTLRLTLEWQATAAVEERYKVFVHVLGSRGLPIAQQDNEPVNGTYPTTQWREGTRVPDPYAVSLPADLAPGEYRVEVGLYRIADLSRLPVLDENQVPVDDKVYLDPITVVSP